MHGALRISEAASLALHTMVLMAGDPGRVFSTREISETMCVSEAHLAKVLQRLAREGMLLSTRGPKGGFHLAGRGKETTLLEIFEAIDGPFEPEDCLMHDKSCGQMGCLFGDLLGDINRQVREYLGSRNLEDVRWVYETPSDKGERTDEA